MTDLQREWVYVLNVVIILATLYLAAFQGMPWKYAMAIISTLLVPSAAHAAMTGGHR